MYESHPLSEKAYRPGSRESIGSRKEKDVVVQLSVAFQDLFQVLVSDKFAATRLGKINRSYICCIC